MKGKEGKKEGKELKSRISKMNNYMGIGVDASIAMDFHQARERNPSFFYSRLVNKLWYFKGGFQQFMKGEFRDFNQHVRLECGGEEVILPMYHSPQHR